VGAEPDFDEADDAARDLRDEDEEWHRAHWIKGEDRLGFFLVLGERSMRPEGEAFPSDDFNVRGSAKADERVAHRVPASPSGLARTTT
jgi:hypothetical protein